MFVVALALTALGFLLAWRMDSTQGFHAVMSVLLLPMWLLSGAFFPAEHGFLHWIMLLNPLTYGVAGLRRLLYWDASPEVQAKAAALPAVCRRLGCAALVTLVVLCGQCSLWPGESRPGERREICYETRALIFWLVVLLVAVAVLRLMGGLAAIWPIAERLASRRFRRPVRMAAPRNLPPGKPTPDFVLTDQNGQEFHSSSLKGKVWVASFFFASCPGPCYRLNQALAGLQAESDFKDVRFVSITCDPADDTPEVLKEYAARFAANPKQWTFLTGDFKKIQDISMSSFVLGNRASGRIRNWPSCWTRTRRSAAISI